jgi:hypothetical protein
MIAFATQYARATLVTDARAIRRAGRSTKIAAFDPSQFFQNSPKVTFYAVKLGAAFCRGLGCLAKPTLE